MDRKNKNQEQEPERKRQRQDDEPKQHGPKKRIRTYKTTQTRRPITKKTPTGNLNLFKLKTR